MNDQTSIINLASLVVTSLTAIALAWIAYKQNILSRVISDVKRQTDGITSKLVDVTDRASRAEGELKGKADSQVRQDAIDVGSSKTALPKTVEPATLKKIEQNTADTAESAARTAENTSLK